MTTLFEHQVGEIGARFIAVARDRYEINSTTGLPEIVDLSSGFTSATFTFYGPDGTVKFTHSGTLLNDGSDGKVYCDTEADNFVVADIGSWEWRCTVVTTGGTYPSKRNYFTLKA